MASLMPKTANGKNRANKASTPLEMEPSVKKLKSSDISFPPPTIENPEGSKQGSPSSGKNQDEDFSMNIFVNIKRWEVRRPYFRIEMSFSNELSLCFLLNLEHLSMV